MTIEDIQARVEEIRTLASDPEAAHSKADSLYLEVLQQVALALQESGTTWLENHLRDLLLAALEVESIEFERWCA